MSLIKRIDEFRLISDEQERSEEYKILKKEINKTVKNKKIKDEYMKKLDFIYDLSRL